LLLSRFYKDAAPDRALIFHGTKTQRLDDKAILPFTACKSLHPEGEATLDPIIHFRLGLRCLVAWLFISPSRNLG
jgi:hypothetical protein